MRRVNCTRCGKEYIVGELRCPGDPQDDICSDCWQNLEPFTSTKRTVSLPEPIETFGVEKNND